MYQIKAEVRKNKNKYTKYYNFRNLYPRHKNIAFEKRLLRLQIINHGLAQNLFECGALFGYDSPH